MIERRPSTVLLTAMLLAGVAIWATGPFSRGAADPLPAATGERDRPAQPEQNATSTAPAATAAELPPATTAAPTTTAPAPETMLLPDGKRVATLNGATDVRPLASAWPKDRPWSPIVGVERSTAGVDWYVHEDGTRSTTEMRWRPDLGRADAVTRIAHPITNASPVPPGGAPGGPGAGSQHRTGN